jgi:hypothetical protein
MAASRPFPRRTLEVALRVPRALKDKNGGNAWPPEHVAQALGVGAKGGNFYYVSAASRDYGLTTGSRETAEISLTDLGRRAVYPESGAAQQQTYLEAFLSVETLRKVLHHYGGNNLPEKPFLTNTLQQTFGIDPEVQDEFIDIFTKNCRFLGIGAQFTSGSGLASRTGGATPTVAGDGGSVIVATPEKGLSVDDRRSNRCQ